MKLLEYGQGCYGPFVRIDGKNLFKSEYDNRSDEEVRKVRLELLNELIESVDSISMDEFSFIAALISQGTAMKFTQEQEEVSPCETCGNDNYYFKYTKNE